MVAREGILPGQSDRDAGSMVEWRECAADIDPFCMRRRSNFPVRTAGLEEHEISPGVRMPKLHGIELGSTMTVVRADISRTKVVKRVASLTVPLGLCGLTR
jgi:hypothetical protein